MRPELFDFGPIHVRWYGVLFAMAFICGYLIARWEYRSEGRADTNLDSLLGYMMFGAVVGARLGHCFFYQPDYFLHHPIEILEVWKGGLASHGGVAGILIALYFYSRRRPEEPYLWVLDRVAVPSALGGVFIRLGNVFNSEILGTPSNLPWAVVFAREDMVPRHPVQLYEAGSYLILFFLLLWIYSRLKEKTPHGLLLGIFMIIMFTARFFLEFVKQRQADYEQNMSISVGQWLSVPFVLFGVYLVWRALRGTNYKV